MVGPLGGRLFTPDARPGATHIMVGGGYGVPPLVFLSRELQIAQTAPNLIVYHRGAAQRFAALRDGTDGGGDRRAARQPKTARTGPGGG